MGGENTSFEPRPKPDITSPSMRRGNGGSGPESGPTIVGRGARGGAASEDIVAMERGPSALVGQVKPNW
jgi:hypothetical protein